MIRSGAYTKPDPSTRRAQDGASPVIFTTDGRTAVTARLAAAPDPAPAPSAPGSAPAARTPRGSRTSGRRRAARSRASAPAGGTRSFTPRITWLSRTAEATRGYGVAASGVATIQNTSSTAIADTTAPSTESTACAGRQVSRCRSWLPIETAMTWPSSAKASTTATATATRQDESSASRPATGSASWAPSTAPPKKPQNDSAAVTKPCRKPPIANITVATIRAMSSTFTGWSPRADRPGPALSWMEQMNR